MGWIEEHQFKMALIFSCLIAGYSFLFHGLNISPNDWGSVLMWIPFYISPLWAVAGISSLTERRKKE